MKVMERVRNLARHEENEKCLPIPETHRIEGWNELIEFTGFSREHLVKFMKLEGLQSPKFFWVRTGDKKLWRKRVVWDKRKIGDWFKAREMAK